MKKLIRRIINWAYGTDLSFDLIILFQAKENLATIIKDLALRSYIMNPPLTEAPSPSPNPGNVVKESHINRKKKMNDKVEVPLHIYRMFIDIIMAKHGSNVPAKIAHEMIINMWHVLLLYHPDKTETK